MRCLLDKVTARYAMQGLNSLKDDIPLTNDETHSLDLLKRAESSQARLFIVSTTWHILNRLRHLPHYSAEIAFFLQQVEVMTPTRYNKRWTRRLREYGFSAEDAKVLSLATFGSDEANTILSVNFVATFDQPLLNNWEIHQSAIQSRLNAMKSDIAAPYNQAMLPQVTRPTLIEF